MTTYSKATVLELLSRFPDHKLYVEPFFETARLYSQKPLAEINLLGVKDHQVANFLHVMKHQIKDFTAHLSGKAAVHETVSDAMLLFKTSLIDLVNTPDEIGLSTEGKLQKLKLLTSSLRAKLKKVQCFELSFEQLLGQAMSLKTPKDCFVFIQGEQYDVAHLYKTLANLNCQFGILTTVNNQVLDAAFEHGLYLKRMPDKHLHYICNHK